MNVFPPFLIFMEFSVFLSGEVSRKRLQLQALSKASYYKIYYNLKRN
jgi:hypothetical protein